MTAARWRPGRDPRAEWHPAATPGEASQPLSGRGVVVVGGGVAGLAAATGLAERGVAVTLVERQPTLGGRVRSWDIDLPGGQPGSMSRGFHAFFRQYYNLRALLRRSDPGLERLRFVEDYPLSLADGPTDSFARIPRTPPLSIAAFVAQSPSFPVSALRHVDVGAALGLLDVSFPETYSEYDGVSAADVLDRLHFPDEARHLALEVFARSFFADPRDFSGGELVAMFHTYFTGSAEGLLFDVPTADYDSALWGPLGDHLRRLGVDLRLGAEVLGIDEVDDGGVAVRLGRRSGARGRRRRARRRPGAAAGARRRTRPGSATPAGAPGSPACGSRRPLPSGASGSIGPHRKGPHHSSGRAVTAPSTTSPSSSRWSRAPVTGPATPAAASSSSTRMPSGPVSTRPTSVPS